MFKKLCCITGVVMALCSAGASDRGAPLLECALYALVGVLLVAAVVVPAYLRAQEGSDEGE
ncbi:MAG: hypothetical protein IJA58_01125 [Lachnospiraceae bacterium]|nr:hypothetical protein [Lachnospiraceae bacterium]